MRINVIAEEPTVDTHTVFHHYSVDASGHLLTLYWNSGNGKPLPREITEDDPGARPWKRGGCEKRAPR